jgi:hypothetical protein
VSPIDHIGPGIHPGGIEDARVGIALDPHHVALGTGSDWSARGEDGHGGG